MPSPKVTIAMPVYNGGGYFRLALESALAQRYDNCEIVVVNDGSTDGGETEAMARDYGERVRYIRQENRGVAGAMNTAVANMTGDYFAWLSHDDLHLPHKTQAQIDYLARLGRRDAILFSDYDLIGPDGHKISSVRLPRERISQSPMLPLLNGMINGCTLLIPAWIIRHYGPFDERLRYVQDYELWNKILGQHEFFHQPEILVEYRIHPDQGTNKPAAATEGDALWIRMLDARSEAERVQLFGSRRRFFASLAEFLDHTPYQGAAAYARGRISDCVRQSLVSIVLVFRDEIALVPRAVRSALAQTHERIEVILVNDGSTEDTNAIAALAREDRRVHVLHQPASGIATARNHGMDAARGDYIAFLDPTGRYLSHKVQRQVERMQRGGALISHTSYYASDPRVQQDWTHVASGAFTGALYPAIIADCPIVAQTVMLHRSLVAGGFRFPTTEPEAAETLAWVALAARHELLGIEEPLSVIEPAADGTLAPIKANARRTMGVLASVLEDPVHNPHEQQMFALREQLRDLARSWKRARIAAGHELG